MVILKKTAAGNGDFGMIAEVREGPELRERRHRDFRSRGEADAVVRNLGEGGPGRRGILNLICVSLRHLWLDHVGGSLDSAGSNGGAGGGGKQTGGNIPA